MMHKEIERAFSLDGRCAVITGAASGIGRQTAITLAQAGAHVVLADIDDAGLEEARAAGTAVARALVVLAKSEAAGLEEPGAAVTAFDGQASTRRVDVTDRDAVEALADF